MSKRADNNQQPIYFSEAELDFKQFNLGQGSVQDKKIKLDAVVRNLLSDDKQLKVHKEVINKIKKDRNRKTKSSYNDYSLTEDSVIMNQSSNDFMSMNA